MCCVTQSLKTIYILITITHCIKITYTTCCNIKGNPHNLTIQYARYAVKT